MSKIQKVFCVNCGNKFECREDRFPVCKCGHTIPLYENEMHYAKIDCSDDDYNSDIFYNTQSDLIIYDNGSETKINENDFITLIDVLPELKFYREDDVCSLLLADLPFDREKLQDYTAAEIYLHHIFCERSTVYNCLFGMGETDAAKAMIHNKDLMNFNNKAQEIFFRETIAVYLEEKTGDTLITAIECCLSRYDIAFCDSLSGAELSVQDFKALIRDTSFSKDTLCRYLNEMSSVFIKGKEAIKMVKEYDFLLKEHELLSVTFDEKNPVYHNHHLASISYNIYLKNGLLEYRKYCSKYRDTYRTIQIDDYKIKLLNGKEITDLPAGILPNGTTAPAIGVYDSDNTLISLLANSNNHIYIQGDQSDKVKKAVNKFLDSTDGINI